MGDDAIVAEVAQEIAAMRARLRASPEDAETALAQELARLVVDRAQLRDENRRLRGDLAAMKMRER